MSQMIKVGMADLNICKSPNAITTLGLGSCIGIAIYDPVTKIGGLAHIMLPDSTKIRNNSNIAKFADTGIMELVNRMVRAGASRTRMVAKIAGGAKMFEISGNSDFGNIGQRNTVSVKKVLMEEGLRISGEDTGASYARTMYIDLATGDVGVRTFGRPERHL